MIKDVPVKFDLKACKWGDFDTANVKNLFQELEFRSLLKKVDAQLILPQKYLHKA